MSVCIIVQVLTQLGGCTKYSRNEMKGSGGAVTNHLSDLLVLGG